MTSGKFKRRRAGKRGAAMRWVGFTLLMTAMLLPTLRVQIWLFNRQPPVNAWTMLFAAKRSGMEPTGFYASGSAVFSGGGNDSLSAARRALRGVPGSQAEMTSWNGAYCLAVSIACPPDPWAAAEAMHRIQSVLGMRAEVSLCLVGRAGDARATEGNSNEETALGLLKEMGDHARDITVDTYGGRYASAMGAAVQAAASSNGEIYIGVPRIVLDY